MHESERKETKDDESCRRETRSNVRVQAPSPSLSISLHSLQLCVRVLAVCVRENLRVLIRRLTRCSVRTTERER